MASGYEGKKKSRWRRGEAAAQGDKGEKTIGGEQEGAKKKMRQGGEAKKQRAN